MDLKFGLGIGPSAPIAGIIQLAKTCERKGFSSIWVADETPWKDPWAVMGLIAASTTKLRIGPGVTHPFLRNPAYIAQSIGTLDEISGGRAFCGISIGSPVMLEQCNIKPVKPFGALKEAIRVIRMMLKGGPVNFDGEHFKYFGVQTCALPTQKEIPIYVGGILGPLSFQVAGEVGDGVCIAHALNASQVDYAIKNVKIGLKRSEMPSREFRVADLIWFSLHRNGDLARDTIRPLMTFYMPWLTTRLLERYKIDKNEFKSVSDLVRKGNLKGAINATSDETVDSLTISGTPEEVVSRLEELVLHGVEEVLIAPVDNALLRSLMGVEVEGALTMEETLDVCSKHVLPSFKETAK